MLRGDGNEMYPISASGLDRADYYCIRTKVSIVLYSGTKVKVINPPYDASRTDINETKHSTAYAHCDTIVRTTMILLMPFKNIWYLSHDTLHAWIILTYS
jgi:hypothetical protein